ncbi:MAG: hypothetical protein K6T59_01260 [Bryobacteraceae bacterium]|nr:hypothetical protein [Bryobacteraceae bacterium]
MKRWGLLGLVLVFLFVWVVPVTADQLQDAKKKQDQLKNKASSLEKQRTETKNQLNQLQKDKTALVNKQQQENKELAEMVNQKKALDQEEAEAEALAGRVWEFSRFLLEVARVEDVGARYHGIVTYHDGCHALRELGIREGPRRLLAHVRGLVLKEMDVAEECCGFGGTFSVKFPEISGAMARTKIASILRTGADTVVSTDSSCLMQLRGALLRAGARVRTLHLAEVLAFR